MQDDTETDSPAITRVETFRTPDGKIHTTYGAAARHMEECLARELKRMFTAAGVPLGPKAEIRMTEFAIANRPTLMAALNY